MVGEEKLTQEINRCGDLVYQRTHKHQLLELSSRSFFALRSFEIIELTCRLKMHRHGDGKGGFSDVF